MGGRAETRTSFAIQFWWVNCHRVESDNVLVTLMLTLVKGAKIVRKPDTSLRNQWTYEAINTITLCTSEVADRTLCWWYETKSQSSWAHFVLQVVDTVSAKMLFSSLKVTPASCSRASTCEHGWCDSMWYVRQRLGHGGWQGKPAFWIVWNITSIAGCNIQESA